MIDVSIVVPVFNRENTIERCINSILNQTFKNIEIIIINDGSTDKTEEICNYYAENNKKIIIINSYNLGVSHARNLGIRHSSGKYIMFIDSDDWIEENTVEIAYNSIKENDLLIYGYVYDTYKNKELIKSNIKSTVKDYCLNSNNIAKSFRYLYNTIDFSSSCNKLFRKQIIEKNLISFDDNSTIFEDLSFNIRVMKKCSNIKIIHNVLYHYTIQSEEFHLDKRKYDIFEDILKAADLLIDYTTYIGTDIKEMKEIQKYCYVIYNLCFKNISNKNLKVSITNRISKIKLLCQNKNFIYIMKNENNKFTRVFLFLIKRRMFISSYILIRWKIK